PRVKDRDDPVWNIGSGSSHQMAGSPPVVPAAYNPPPLAAPLSQQPTEQRLVAPEPARATAYADETMELPIFRELESAWFRTRPETGTAPAAAPQATAAHPPPPVIPAPAVPPPYVPQAATPPPVVPASPVGAGGLPGSMTGGAQMGTPTSAGRTPAQEPVWRSAAD